MEASVRPWFTTGVAFVGAGAIALTPIAPTPTPLAEKVHAATSSVASVATVASDFRLAALDIPYLLTLPIVRQYVSNVVESWTVLFGGFAQAGVGFAQSLLAVPGVTAQIVQQVVALDFVGALNTFAQAARDSIVAVGQPLLESWIWRAQKTLVVQAAMQAAVPVALISVANGFLLAGGGIATALIESTQSFIAAVLTLDPANIVNAAIVGTQNVVAALGAGAGSVVSGIEGAQQAIATALATEPPFSVSSVAGLAGSSVSSTALRIASTVASPEAGTASPELASAAAAPAETTSAPASTDPAPATEVAQTVEPSTAPSPTTAPSASPTSSATASSTSSPATDAVAPATKTAEPTISDASTGTGTTSASTAPTAVKKPTVTKDETSTAPQSTTSQTTTSTTTGAATSPPKTSTGGETSTAKTSGTSSDAKSSAGGED